MKICASLLAGPHSFARLKKLITPAYRASLLRCAHVDVMDGKFVKNNTRSWQNVALVRKLRRAFPKLQIEVHLMVREPHEYITEFARAGVDRIYFHIEACGSEQKVEFTRALVQASGIQAGLAINPRTKLEKIKKPAKRFDSLLVMSVQPGKGGQRFRKSALKRIKQMRRWFPNKHINVDGGVNPRNIALAKGAGASCAVAGTAVFEGNIEKNFKLLWRRKR